MSDRNFERQVVNPNDGMDGRRRQLRNLLLTAADTARQTRVRQLTTRLAAPVGRAVRDRVSMLLSAAG